MVLAVIIEVLSCVQVAAAHFMLHR